MYIFKYVNRNTGDLIGYHLSTFCQTGPKEKAKRYQCTGGPESQMDIIRKNLKYTLEVKDNDDGLFSSLNRNTKETHFKGLSFEDIELESEYLIDGITPDDIEYRIHTVINNGEVHKVDLPIEAIGEILKENHQSKNN